MHPMRRHIDLLTEALNPTTNARTSAVEKCRSLRRAPTNRAWPRRGFGAIPACQYANPQALLPAV